MPAPEPSTCPDCGGDGWQDGEFCITCMGGGSIPVVGINRYLKEHMSNMEDKLNDIKEKVDEIKAIVDEL